MEKIILKTKNGDYACLFHKGEEINEVALVYWHGLEGKSKMIQPLLNHFSNFDIYSIEQRGHKDSLQKKSISVKKHDQDVYNVVQHIKNKYRKVFLLGESMGAIFVARYAFKYSDISGVFCWSIPFKPKDIMKEKKGKKTYIISRVILTFLTSINYSYTSIIDYPKLTNSKLLLKLNELDVETVRQTSEAVAVWKACFKVKRLFLKKSPKSNLVYWHGENDFMSPHKLIKKMANKNRFSINFLPNAKHIIMYEKEASVMFEKIKIIILQNLNDV